jgi:TetR/AcrR family fatty acid metabolism transcriptional regulator
MTAHEPLTSAGRLSLKQRQRWEREQLILEAAEVLLAEQGYHGTTMEEIASQVGISKGTVYLHFPSKDELIYALFERQVSAFRQSVEDAIMERAPARVRLEHILRDAFTQMFTRHTRLNQTLAAALSGGEDLVEQRAVLRDEIRRIARGVGVVLDEGKAAGEFDTAVPTPVMVAAFLSLMSPRTYLRILDENDLSPDVLAASVGQIYFSGIRHKASSEE